MYLPLLFSHGVQALRRGCNRVWPRHRAGQGIAKRPDSKQRPRYRTTNTETGKELGQYRGADPGDAIDALARDVQTRTTRTGSITLLTLIQTAWTSNRSVTDTLDKPAHLFS
jgi:hypothetical protein